MHRMVLPPLSSRVGIGFYSIDLVNNPWPSGEVVSVIREQVSLSDSVVDFCAIAHRRR